MLMNDLLYFALTNIGEFLIVLCIFCILVYIGKFVFKQFKDTSYFKSSRFFNPQEYLPEEELSTIKQVFYLIMIVILVMNILYILFVLRDDSLNLLIFDVIISTYLAIHLDLSSFKNKFILFLLVPFGSFTYLIFPDSSIVLFDFIHVFVFLYYIKQYYKKFLDFTENNSLGITIMLLFLIVFISFFVTIVVEGVSPIDSIVMVSNAFTSNGYAILGTSGLGKVNALFLVWTGFILSGVGTATLTVAIVMGHVNNKFDRLENLVKKNKKD